MTKGTHMTVYMVFNDGECDQIVETEAQAKREKRDLEKMGCYVTLKKFDSWEAAEAYEDKLRS